MIPERWVIKITRKNRPIVQQYTHCNKDLDYEYSLGAFYGNKCNGEWNKPDKDKEITIEYFIKYIVNKEHLLEEVINEDYNYLKIFLKKLNIK